MGDTTQDTQANEILRDTSEAGIESQSNGNSQADIESKDLTQLKGYGGKTFKSLDDVYEFFNKQENIIREKDKFIGELRNQLGTVNEKIAGLDGRFKGLTERQSVSPEEDRIAREQEFYNNPVGMIEKTKTSVLDEVNKAIETKTKEILNQIELREKRKENWDKFYDKNKHLRQWRDDLIPALTSQLLPEIANLSIDEAHDRIAKEANKKIIEFQRRGTVDNSERSSSMRGGTSGTFADVSKDPNQIGSEELRKAALAAINKVTERVR